VQHTPMPTCTFSLKLGSLELPISPAYTKLWSIVVFTCLRICREGLGVIFLKVGSLGVVVANPLPYI